MKVEQLITELYGDKAIPQLLRKTRGDYRPYLKREWRDLTRSEIEALAHGLYLHGKTTDIEWAWHCHDRHGPAITAAGNTNPFTERKSNRWEL